MLIIRREPFYPISKIATGKYTAGGEFVYYEDLSLEYIGLYHILPNDQCWTETAPNSKSKLIVPKRFDASEDVKIYNNNKNIIGNNYISPINKMPHIENHHYISGEILRYFVQKKNSPLNTIYEIDREQFLTLNNSNRPGINSSIWNHIVINWKLTGDMAGEINKNTIEIASQKFKGIEFFLTNYFEFVK